MPFRKSLWRLIRILLFPFSLFYALVAGVRNRLYDKGIFTSASFSLPLICIGNLSLGGTGKSTLVEFLLGHFHQDFRMAVLSRGYRRRTKGYALANPRSSALDIGDEPMQFYRKFPEVTIAVGEERIVAIPQLLHDKPDTEVILLDDALQHRSIRAGLNILLTDHANLFTRDWMLPTGNLRDSRSGYKRCQLIVVTKCPIDLTEAQAAALQKDIHPLPEQKLFFAALEYGVPYHLFTRRPAPTTKDTSVLLVTGIANTAPLKNYVQTQFRQVRELEYRDHHIFTIDDWTRIKAELAQLPGNDKILLTTEKDAVRLIKFESAIRQEPVYVLPVQMRFLFQAEDIFLNQIRKYILENLHQS